ncbi:hypothetical protein ACQEVF_17720 [Nonomuraea polychroma]|uniref:hypothetical protein n=1 Tax=Nonomuraea polychroma TaxID=46176 RepID=UPI003D89B852
MADIELLDAWRMWLDGQQIARETWNGWPILYWGRAGKIAAFAGGLTIILDLLGPEKIAQIGLHIRRTLYRKPDEPRDNTVSGWILITAVFTAASALHFLVVVPLMNEFTDLDTLFHWYFLILAFVAEVFAVGTAITLAGLLFSWVLTAGTPGFVVRLLATVSLVVGFHFDLLAS